MKDLLSDLNPAQREAVSWPPVRPLLILAGAGSGKTRTLVAHYLRYLSKGRLPRQVVAITFTEKAAEYGLDVMGLSNHAAFFDYDHDGDLDCA